MPKPKFHMGVHVRATKFTIDKTTGKFKRRYYWNLISKNGRELIRSSEMYNSKQAAINGLMATVKHFEKNTHYYDHTIKDGIKTGTSYFIVYDKH